MTQPETLSKPGQMLRQLSHKAADYIERILKKILPQIKKETIKRLLVWAGWVLMLIAETVLDSVE